MIDKIILFTKSKYSLLINSQFMVDSFKAENFWVALGAMATTGIVIISIFLPVIQKRNELKNTIIAVENEVEYFYEKLTEIHNLNTPGAVNTEGLQGMSKEEIEEFLNFYSIRLFSSLNSDFSLWDRYKHEIAKYDSKKYNHFKKTYDWLLVLKEASNKYQNAEKVGDRLKVAIFNDAFKRNLQKFVEENSKN
jgi:hypothetical protein